MEKERREFLKKGGAAVVGLAGLARVKVARAKNENKSWVMIIDLNSCTGCQSCVIACKRQYRTSEGLFRTKIVTGEGENGSAGKATFTPTLCNHCEKPLCAKMCDDGAISAGSDGIVRVDPEKCQGAARCKSKGRCVEPCAIKAAELNGEDGRMEKCSFCQDRLGKGLMPACVENCPSGARIFGDENRPSKELAEYLRHPELSTPQGVKGGRVRYVALRGEKGGLRV